MNPRLEYQRLQAMHGLHLLQAPPPVDLEDFCHEAQGRFHVTMALVTLVYGDRQLIWASAGTDIEGTSRSDAFCDHLIRCDEVLVVPDAKKDDRFSSNPLVTGRPYVRFYAGRR